MRAVSTEFGPVLLEDEEQLVEVKQVRSARPTERPGAVDRLAALCGVDGEANIGTAGPVAAARVEDPDAAPELRRIEAVFGRDALLVCSIVADRFPVLRESTVLYFAQAQGVAKEFSPEPEYYEGRVEALGKIPHEMRDPDADEFAMALTDERGWRWPYFGSDDSTALFALEAFAAIAHRPEFADEKVLQRDGQHRTVGEAVARAVD